MAFRAVPAASAGRCLELDGVLAGITPAVPERSLPNSVLYETEDALEAALPHAGGGLRRRGHPGLDGVGARAPRAGPRRCLADAGHKLDATPTAMIADLHDVEAPRPATPCPTPSPCSAISGGSTTRPTAPATPSSESSATGPPIPASTTSAPPRGPCGGLGREPGPRRRLQHLVGGRGAGGARARPRAGPHAPRSGGRPGARLRGEHPPGHEARAAGVRAARLPAFGTIEMWERRSSSGVVLTPSGSGCRNGTAAGGEGCVLLRSRHLRAARPCLTSRLPIRRPHSRRHPARRKRRPRRRRRRGYCLNERHPLVEHDLAFERAVHRALGRDLHQPLALVLRQLLR